MSEELIQGNKIMIVTGGAGFIGTNLVKKLLSRGHSVRVFDNYAAGKKPERLQKDAQYIEGDIRDLDALKKAFKGADGVFHQAAIPRVPYSVEHPEETHDVNVNGTLNVLLAARDCGVKRLVFASSSSSYGNLSKDQYPVKEDVVIKKPIAPYALHKYIGEHYCRLFSLIYGLETVSLVYFNIYGPYADPDGAYALVIGKFLKQIKEGKPMTVCGDGEYYRDYTHVDDAVSANILAMEKETIGKGEVINIGNSKPYSVNDLVRMIGGESVNIDPRPGDVRYTCADNSKAKKLLGWEPKVKLEDGIKDLKDFYLNG
jgi:nucleoside-diphosphate-sugar epimerase